MTDALQGAPVSAQPEDLTDELCRRKVIWLVENNDYLNKKKGACSGRRFVKVPLPFISAMIDLDEQAVP